LGRWPWGLLLVPFAQAKLAPTFSERSVMPGELARLDLGVGADPFPAPLKVYLVPLAVSEEVTRQSDPRLTKIGELAIVAGLVLWGWRRSRYRRAS
jgi:hypothetical protein